jgi:hypothetical protein
LHHSGRSFSRYSALSVDWHLRCSLTGDHFLASTSKIIIQVAMGLQRIAFRKSCLDLRGNTWRCLQPILFRRNDLRLAACGRVKLLLSSAELRDDS